MPFDSLTDQIEDKITQEVTVDLTRMITDGVRLHEVLSVLNTWLKTNRGCIVGYHPPYYCKVMAYSDGRTTKSLFSHVSLATCIEFALNPDKDITALRRPEPDASYGERQDHL